MIGGWLIEILQHVALF